MSNELVFNGYAIQTVDHNNQIWIAASELAKVLGYQRSDKISQIYQRNADEFTPSMSQTLNLRFSEETASLSHSGVGNLQKEVRVFSLRGCHLIAMFAKTRVAKAFRRWVLDILDRETVRQLPVPTLTPEEQRWIQKTVAAKTKNIINREKAFALIYHALKDRFGVAKYSQIPSERFEEAVNFVEQMELPDWEKRTDVRVTFSESETLKKINALSVELHCAVRELIPLFERVSQTKKLLSVN